MSSRRLYTVSADFEIHVPDSDDGDAVVDNILDTLAGYCNDIANDSDCNIYFGNDTPVLKATYDDEEDE